MLHKQFTIIQACSEGLGSDNDLTESVDYLSYTPEVGDLVWMNPEAQHDRNYEVVAVQKYAASNAVSGSEPMTLNLLSVKPIGAVVPPRLDYDFEEVLYIRMKGNEFDRLSFAGGDNLAPVIGTQIFEPPDYATVLWENVDLGNGVDAPIGRSTESWKPTNYFIERFDTLVCTSTSKPDYAAIYVVWCAERVPVAA